MNCRDVELNDDINLTLLIPCIVLSSVPVSSTS
jgi:hypothetical protein